MVTQPDPQAPPALNPPASTPAPDVDKTFTQADVDRLIADRLKRAKPADYDDVKAKAKQFDDLQAATASDLEKAVTAARKEGETEATKRANARLVSAEARALAAEMQFRKPGHAVRLIDLSAVSVGDDGEVDTAAVRTLLDDLAKDDPLLLVVPDDGRPKGNADQGVRAPAPTGNARLDDLAQIEADLKAASRRT
jgi:maltoporin